MGLRLNTAINVPDFDYVINMVQSISNEKGIPFSFGKLSNTEKSFRDEAKRIKDEVTEILSQKIPRVGWIDYTGRTKGRDHIVSLICKYYEYPDTIFINPKNNLQYLTNEEVVSTFKERFYKDRGEKPVLIDKWEEIKTLNHAISNSNQLMKARLEYIKANPDKKEEDLFYVYPKFNVGATGRISAKEPAIQSLVDEYKNCITAPDGYKIVHMDVSGQEVHILTCGILENPTLLEKYIDMEDPYLAILSSLNLPLDEEHRSLAKVPILGLMNGMGRNSIRRNMGESFKIADMMIDLIEKDKGYVNKVDSYVNSELKNPNKYRKGMFGTKFPVNKWRNPQTQLKNGFFQVTAAEIMVFTTQAIYEKMYEVDPTLDTMRLLTTIYDEYIFLIRDDFLEEGKEIVEHYCLPLVNNWPRFLGEIKEGQHYVAG